MAITSSARIAPDLDKAILAAIEEGLTKAYEPIIADAKAKLDKELRAKLAEYVMHVARYYEVQRDGTNVVITVRNNAKLGEPTQ
jgi:hypothetical protein